MMQAREERNHIYGGLVWLIYVSENGATTTPVYGPENDIR